MPNEPERDIEKRLRAYAEKRRQDAGEPLELHPATRRLLQGEVSRQRAKPAGGGATWLERVIAAHWLEAAVAACVVAALAIGVVMLRPPSSAARKEEELAYQQLSANAPAMDLAKAGTPQPAATAPEPGPWSANTGSLQPSFTLPKEVKLSEVPPTDKNRFLLAKDLAFSEAEGEVPSFPPTAVPETGHPEAAHGVALTGGRSGPGLRFDKPEVAEAERREASATLGTFVAGDKLRAQPALPAPVGQPASPPGRSDLVPSEVKEDLFAGTVATSRAAVFAQNFANVAKQVAPRKVAAQPDLPDVLNNFRVEQSGERIQIIDQDGSTYAGNAQASRLSQFFPERTSAGAPVSSAVALKQKLGGGGAGGGRAGAFGAERGLADRATEAQRQAQSYFFRVAGTNRALNEPVVFTGQLFLLTNAAVAEAAPVADEKRARLLKAAAKPGQTQAVPAPLQNYRITGAAVVGEKQTINVDAVSVPTP